MKEMFLFFIILSVFNFAISYMRDRGLSQAEKQRFLDLHNAYRLRVALGKQPGQPEAANLIAVEWDDKVMEGAQKWADTCQGWHDHNTARRFQPFPYVGQDFTGNFGVDESVKQWYDEVKDFEYYSMGCRGICGHYTQVLWWNSVYMGCGYNGCKGRNAMTLTYCNMAPGGNTAFDGIKDKPYEVGKACSRCPQGFSFCMGGGLCASKRACSNTESSCECTLHSCENGGNLDSASCSCKCKPGFEGARCEKKCKDEIDYCEDFEMECKWNAELYMWMDKDCRKTCDKCGSVIPKGYVSRNALRLKTNAKELETILKTKLKGLDRGKPTTPPPRPKGYCKNLKKDEFCDAWTADGQCEDNKEWMTFYCASSCNSCSTRIRGKCDNIYDDLKCEDWAHRGNCEANPYFMKANCPSSCNSC